MRRNTAIRCAPGVPSDWARPLPREDAMQLGGRTRVAWLVASLITIAGVGAASAVGVVLPRLMSFANPDGTHTTLVSEPATRDNPFFQSLGTNGRSCVTCHAPEDGWSITPASVEALFVASSGRAPLFRTNDGSTSPNADVSTLSARRTAYSLLLSKGLIRVGRPIPS